MRRRRARACSTPFGITEFGTRRRVEHREAVDGAQRLSASLSSAHARQRCDAPRLSGAQRLSASLNSARVSRRCGVQPSSVCSTPFGITEIRHASVRAIGRRRRSVCSTPFGITEFGTPIVAGDRAATIECSTPFGITEFGTVPTRRPRPRRSGAQRLSASLNSAPANRVSAAVAEPRCSTPFGITEFGTAP